jgi:hypothetical protein
MTEDDIGWDSDGDFLSHMPPDQVAALSAMVFREL